jgi:putative flavoprotein involved in K+ transport
VARSLRLAPAQHRDDLVAYLRDYAAHHSLEVRSGVDVERIARERDAWTIVTSSGAEGVAGVVVATGHSQEPVLPDWAGTDRFTGRLLHSAAYRRASDHAGSRVVVVGAGSSGGEICVDLATAGHDVVWSVRTAPRVFPREAMGVPTTPFAPIGDGLPDRWVDRVAPMIERWIHGARDYLPEPPAPMMQLLARCKEPMTADGIVDLIRDGRVRVVAAVDHLDGDVVLVDGSREPADDVIAATGYRPGLERLVGHLGVLRDGRPRAAEPLPGLHFVGYRVPLTGTLWAIETDARRAARRLGRQLGTG